MNPRHLIPTWPAVAATSLAAAAILTVAAAAQGAQPTTRLRVHPGAEPYVPLEVQARESFRARRYAEAYGRYAELADAGHAGAAAVALLMVAEGPALFGTEWSATPGQLQRWQRLAERYLQERSAVIPLHERAD
jgi:hypothetical protein